MSLPEYPLDGLPLPRPEPLVAELGKGLVQHGVAVRLARRRIEVWPEIVHILIDNISNCATKFLLVMVGKSSP